MRWQHLTWQWVWVGSLAACHSGGDAAAPDGKTPATTTTEPAAEGAPAAGAAGASATEPPTTPVEPPATTSDPAAAPDAECETRRAAIEAALGEAGRCASDAECTLMYPNCPFGCARPIGTSANLDALQANIEAFKAACNSCVYRCMPPKGAPTCNAGRCSFGDG